MVICENTGWCDDSRWCGGAKPHMRCSECGECVRNPSQKCVEYKKSEWKFHNNVYRRIKYEIR